MRITEGEKKSQRVGKSSLKELWKFQVNETNFGGIFLVIFKYASNFLCMMYYLPTR